MKSHQFLIFFSIVLGLYALINAYIFIRAWQALPPGSPVRPYFVGLFWFLSLSYIAARFIERVAQSVLTDLLIWIGSFWLAAMVYLLIVVLLVDFARVINLVIPIFPQGLASNLIKAKQIAAIGAAVVVAAVVLAGYINARSPRVKTFELAIAKPGGELKSLHLVAASDIHLGTIVGRARLRRLIAAIEEVKPDIVLFPGDIVDEDLGPVIRENIGEELRRIKAPLGVYAVTGNHEYIGGVERACAYLTEHGITMLRDSAVLAGGSFYLVGREDRSRSGFAGQRRKELADLMATVDRRYPIILMDHQPFHLEEAVAAGVDLQLSGHTHHGQLWPFNFITKKVYELSWGYRRIGSTHVYVSSGYGTWGPPVRTGNHPEIVSITLQFE